MESPLYAGDVIVLGSINVDHSIYVDAFPQPGETVLANGGAKGLGGKGANQAVAAALLGARVRLLGRVGDDDAAGFVRSRLGYFGISDTDLIVSQAATGAAYITVEASGENTVAVVSGANTDVDPDGLARAFDAATDEPATDGAAATGAAGAHDSATHAVGLAQGETSKEMTAAFAAHCRAAGIRFALNLAPAIDLDRDTIALADPLIVNEGEARELLQRFDHDIDLNTVDDARQAAERMLAAQIATSVIITLGSDGAVAAAGDRVWREPSPQPETVVDTTGAGDAFVGAVVAVLSGGRDLADAVRWAVAAGSKAVATKGTTDSYPSADELAGAVTP